MIATATFIWLVSFVPYPLLAILVGLFDLIPVIGSAVAGVLVALAALTVSLPVCLATIGFFVAYKFFEDYVLSPKVFGKVLKLPALVRTIVALLIGGALLGIVGALVALPIAAALLLLTQQLLLPRLDRHQTPPSRRRAIHRSYSVNSRPESASRRYRASVTDDAHLQATRDSYDEVAGQYADYVLRGVPRPTSSTGP